MCAISSRARIQIATKPSQRFGTPTVECPRRGDVRKYASAEERAAKNQNTTVRHFGFTEKVYGLPCTVRTLLWKRHHRIFVGSMKYLCIYMITKVTLMMIDDVPNGRHDIPLLMMLLSIRHSDSSLSLFIYPCIVLHGTACPSVLAHGALE